VADNLPHCFLWSNEDLTEYRAIIDFEMKTVTFKTLQITLLISVQSLSTQAEDCR
jgi:hypothetical protein